MRLSEPNEAHLVQTTSNRSDVARMLGSRDPTSVLAFGFLKCITTFLFKPAAFFTPFYWPFVKL